MAEKPQHLDDLARYLSETGRREYYADPIKALEAAHLHNEDKEFINHISRMLGTAHQKFYDTVQSNEGLIDGSAKAKDKEKEIKSAILHGLLEYFKLVKPKLHGHVKEILDEQGEDAAYENIVNFYDNNHILKPDMLPEQLQQYAGKSIKALVESVIKDETGDVTVDFFINALRSLLEKNTQSAVFGVNNKVIHDILGKFDNHEYQSAVKPLLGENGYEIAGPKFYNLGSDAISDLYSKAIKKGLVSEEDTKAYHIKKKAIKSQ